MKKFIFIALFALVTLQVKAQNIECFKVDHIELKTWSKTYQQFVVTESFKCYNYSSVCFTDYVVSFSLNDEFVNYELRNMVSKEIVDNVKYTVWNLTNGGTMTVSVTLKGPYYMIVSTLFNGKVTTYHILEQ